MRVKSTVKNWCIAQLLDAIAKRQIIVKLLTLIYLKIHKDKIVVFVCSDNFEDKYFDKSWNLQNQPFYTDRTIKRKLISTAITLREEIV